MHYQKFSPASRKILYEILLQQIKATRLLVSATSTGQVGAHVHTISADNAPIYCEAVQVTEEK